MGSLQGIREYEKEDRIFTKTLQEPENTQLHRQRSIQSVLTRLRKGDSHNGKGWKLVTSGTRRKAAAPPADRQLQNRFGAVVSDEGLGAPFRAASEPAEPKSHGSTRRLLALRDRGFHLPA